MPDAVTLRAHQVLCLQGFRGEGYSAAFVAEMTKVHQALAADPERRVRLVAEPDRLCDACIHLREGGCTLGGAAHEDHMRAQDRVVLGRLGLREGDPRPWREILARIGAQVRGADLPGICTTCPWLPLGWCGEGVEALGTPEDEPNPKTRARGGSEGA